MTHPTFSIEISRASGAPPRPGSKRLAEVFTAAWELIPQRRRPCKDDLPRLAVDIHIISDDEIAELNQTHMQHEGPTDVISFPMLEQDPVRRAFHLGEIMVSFETAKSEAQARKLSYEEEFLRYCVHGFLHLCGYDDDTEAKRRSMFKVQEAALDILKKTE